MAGFSGLIPKSCSFDPDPFGPASVSVGGCHVATSYTLDFSPPLSTVPLAYGLDVPSASLTVDNAVSA